MVKLLAEPRPWGKEDARLWSDGKQSRFDEDGLEQVAFPFDDSHACLLLVERLLMGGGRDACAGPRDAHLESIQGISVACLSNLTSSVTVTSTTTTVSVQTVMVVISNFFLSFFFCLDSCLNRHHLDNFLLGVSKSRI